MPINTSLIAKDKLKKALAIIDEAYQAGFCVSELIAVAQPGEKLGSVIVPEGKVGIGTICSVVVNGVLSKSGVPISSKFGGVLELRSPKQERFVAIIYYEGTSLDPSEQYIRARMTSVREAAKTGKGRILANFREIPAPSRAMVSEKMAGDERGRDTVASTGWGTQANPSARYRWGRTGWELYFWAA